MNYLIRAAVLAALAGTASAQGFLQSLPIVRDVPVVRDAAREIDRGVGNVARETQVAAGNVARETQVAAGNIARETQVAAGNVARETQIAAGNIARETGIGLENARREAERGAGNVARETGIFLGNVVAEGGRACDNVWNAGVAIVRYTGREFDSTRESLERAAKRIQEGKIVDAIWHVSLDQFVAREENAAHLMRESELLRTVAQVAAGAYGGPAGTAAFASWYTYRMTGDATLAIKAGVVAGASSYAFSVAGDAPVHDASDVMRQTIVGAAIGGVATAASGGDEEAIRKGMLIGGATAGAQATYKLVTTHKLDDQAMKSAKGEPYAKKEVLDPKDPHGMPAEAYVRDSAGRIVVNDDGSPKFSLDKLDRSRPQVGIESTSDGVTNLRANPQVPSGAAETAPFMTGIARNVPGMNGMAVFHDKICFLWDTGPELTKATIPPAIYFTYAGSGAAFSNFVAEENIAQATK